LQRDFDRLAARFRLKKLPLVEPTESVETSFLEALNWAVASSSARLLLGIVPFCVSSL
jgi:hypothetical protein